MKKTLGLFICLLLMLSTAQAFEGVSASPKILGKPLIGELTLENGKSHTFRTTITGTGTTGYTKCELGLYTEQDVRSWFGGKLPGYDIKYSIGPDESNIANCVSGQDFVSTKSVWISNGQKIDAEFEIYVPKTFDTSKDYVIGIWCFNHCFNDDPDNSVVYGADSVKVTLKGETEEAVNHCENFMTDSDETDYDCGGSCTPCKYGYKCREGSDCQTGYCDQYNVCRNVPEEAPEPEPAIDTRILYIAGGGLVAIIAGILLFVILTSKKR